MAKITDPDLLNQNTEVIFDPEHRTIQLVKTGNLTDDGVTLQCLYSFCKEEWKNDNNLIKYPFPFIAITPEQFELVNGWRFRDYYTIKLLRDGGVAVKDNSGNSLQEYIGFISLGSLADTDQIYIQQSSDGSPSDIHYAGPANEAVLVYSSGIAITDEYLGTGDGSTADFYVTLPPIDDSETLTVKVDGTTQTQGTDYTVDYDIGKITFESGSIPANGEVVTASYTPVDANYKSYLKCFVREWQKTYTQSELSDIGVTTVTYQAYRFPLSNTTDTKVTHTESYVSSHTPYTNMAISYLDGFGFTDYNSGTTYAENAVVQYNGRWYRSLQDGNQGHTPDSSPTWWESYPGERQIGTSYYAFNRIINGADGTCEEIYEFVQYELRQNANINTSGTEDGTPIGKTADLMLYFLGDTLVTYNGVFIDNFNATDTNRIQFYDVNGNQRTFPYVAAGVIEFNDNLQQDSDAIYVMYFTDPDGTPDSGDEFGTSGAIIVEDNDGSPIQGNVGGNSSVSFTFDYDNNDQGGRIPGTDAEVVIVAIGLTKAQYVKATGYITRSTQNKFSLVAPLERNYVNP